MDYRNGIRRISKALWEIPITFKSGMRVPARIYATPQLLESMEQGVFEQITNVAMLPGVLKYACCMPDGHWGYGFPIGGVAAMDLEEGVISPGGIGFDINCGMRLVRTSLTYEEVKPKLSKLVDRLFMRIPSGVGGKGPIRISKQEFGKVLEYGAKWAVKKGYGWEEDLDCTEDKGCCRGADPSTVSQKAIERGYEQIGSLGSGNHYLEIQVAKPEFIHDPDLSRQLGIDLPNQVVVMFHCGSRGFGHQVATDYLHRLVQCMTSKYHIKVPDRNLACAPFRSPEGQDYFAAMNCAMNMAFANRQMILHFIREVFGEVFHKSPEDLGMYQVYDVTHNTAKIETHVIDGRPREVLVHRKGSTRALGPASDDLPAVYRHTGQPVIIGGSMETGSYLLVGTPQASESFFSTTHGSGRVMSRAQARKQFHGRDIQKQLADKGVYVQTASYAGLAEEAGVAYKSIDDVVAAASQAGLSKPVVRFVPVGNIKG